MTDKTDRLVTMPTRPQLIEAVKAASYRSEDIAGETYVENYAHCFADSVWALLAGEYPTDEADPGGEVEGLGGLWHQTGPDEAHERWRCATSTCGWKPAS